AVNDQVYFGYFEFGLIERIDNAAGLIFERCRSLCDADGTCAPVNQKQVGKSSANIYSRNDRFLRGFSRRGNILRHRQFPKRTTCPDAYVWNRVSGLNLDRII